MIIIIIIVVVVYYVNTSYSVCHYITLSVSLHPTQYVITSHPVYYYITNSMLLHHTKYVITSHLVCYYITPSMLLHHTQYVIIYNHFKFTIHYSTFLLNHFCLLHNLCWLNYIFKTYLLSLHLSKSALFLRWHIILLCTSVLKFVLIERFCIVS